jgi:hypothetical protein
VKWDDWVHDGRTGIILEVQGIRYCIGAYVLLDVGIKLIRLDNLKLIQSADT